MLSEEARADSIPGLEIEADDVRCTHGATTGRVDDEQIFYCRCRGLTRKEAIRTVVEGFFQQVFDRITIESVRDALAEAIRRRVREFESSICLPRRRQTLSCKSCDSCEKIGQD